MLRNIVIGAVVGLVAIACTSDGDESPGTAGNGGAGASGGAGAGGGGAPDGGGTGGGSGGSAGSGASGGDGGGGGGSGGTGGTTGGSSGQAGSDGVGGAGGGGGACTSPSGKGPCDTLPQCGCLLRNCDVTGADGTTECVSAGTVLPWNACSDFGQCAKGYTCVSGVCHAFCEDATSVCPGMNARCIQLAIDGNAIPGMFVCTRTCNPVDPSQDDATFDACGPGLGCYPSGTSASRCYGPTTATGSQWANCADLSGNPDDSKCAPGYVCSLGLTCLKYCLMESASCPVDTQCYNFNPVQFAGNKAIGYCS
jgi:hypothetical protein